MMYALMGCDSSEPVNINNTEHTIMDNTTSANTSTNNASTIANTSTINNGNKRFKPSYGYVYTTSFIFLRFIF